MEIPVLIKVNNNHGKCRRYNISDIQYTDTNVRLMNVDNELLAELINLYVIYDKASFSLCIKIDIERSAERYNDLFGNA